MLNFNKFHEAVVVIHCLKSLKYDVSFVEMVSHFLNDESCSLRFATGKNLVLNLQCSQALMIENFTDMSFVEVEVSVGEVRETNNDRKNHHVWVVISMGIERIVTELVTVGHIVDVVLLLKGMSVSVSRELLSVAIR